MIETRRETKFEISVALTPIFFKGLKKILRECIQFANEIMQDLKFTTTKSKNKNPNLCRTFFQFTHSKMKIEDGIQFLLLILDGTEELTALDKDLLTLIT